MSAGNTRPDPPRLAARLLASRLPPEWHDYVAGDLEEFHARCGRIARRGAPLVLAPDGAMLLRAAESPLRAAD